MVIHEMDALDLVAHTAWQITCFRKYCKPTLTCANALGICLSSIDGEDSRKRNRR